jgi:catechol 2,3-dioxygenase-like lactoylglutathione lyase family enzyme
MTGPEKSESQQAGSLRGWLDLTAAPRVHHSCINCRDLELSRSFYADGIGMDVLMEQDAPHGSQNLRIMFLGSKEDTSAGLVELLNYDDAVEPAQDNHALTYGFSMLTFYVDFDATLRRLAEIGVEPEHVTEFPSSGGQVRIAMVRDPDGVVVELVSVTPDVG